MQSFSFPEVKIIKCDCQNQNKLWRASTSNKSITSHKGTLQGILCHLGPTSNTLITYRSRRAWKSSFTLLSLQGTCTVIRSHTIEMTMQKAGQGISGNIEVGPTQCPIIVLSCPLALGLAQLLCVETPLICVT